MSSATTAPLTENSKSRVLGLDVIRGVAVLGILMLNIVDFGWPNEAYNNPQVLYYDPSSIGPLPDKSAEEAKSKDKSKDKKEKSKDKDEWKRMADRKPDISRAHPGGITKIAAVRSPYDVAEWATMGVFFADKMRTLFCIMFGAGVIYLTQRTVEDGGRPLWLYYRRIFILMVIGAMHGYLVWHGDILFMYAAIGLYLYPFRRCSSKTLGWISLGMFLLVVSFIWSAAVVIHQIRTHGASLEKRVIRKADAAMAAVSIEKPEDYSKARGDARLAAVNSLQWSDQLLLRGYLGLRSSGGQRPEEVTRKIRMYGEGSYFGMVKDRAKELIFMHMGMLTPLGFLGMGWLMILGMSLAKNGFFAGLWPVEWYRTWAFRVVPAIWIAEAFFIWADYLLPGMNSLNMIVMVPLRQALIPALSLGYASAIILALKGGYFSGLTWRLSNVGRMALSNYLAQSLICTFFFYSFGLGMFGHVPRTWLVVVVLSIWCLELWWSPRWLANHNFGPVEWVWRGLAYRKFPPFRKTDPTTTIGSVVQTEPQPA
jgi:uncharacterized protein